MIETRHEDEIGANAARDGGMPVAEAFAYCERMAREHYENFPVGSLLVPQDRRKHVCSIYAFARTADDFADEGYDEANGPTEAQRLAALDDWGRQLDACLEGRAEHPVFIALAASVRELNLPPSLLHDLLSAFRQDVTKRRYASFSEVLDYCTRSANPVGRLILLLFGYRDEALHRLSDFICTALQLANFWQDVDVDLRKDRIYLPLDELEAYGVSLADLEQRRFTPAYASLLRFQVDRTRDLFAQGRRLPALVSGRLSVELRLTWLGGMRILEKIEAGGYDTLHARPTITTRDKIELFLRALIGRQ